MSYVGSDGYVDGMGLLHESPLAAGRGGAVYWLVAMRTFSASSCDSEGGMHFRARESPLGARSCGLEG